MESEFMLEDRDFSNFRMAVLEEVLTLLEMARTSQSHKDYAECTINITCGKYCLHSTFLIQNRVENCHSEAREAQCDSITALRELRPSWKHYKRESRRKCFAMEKIHHKTRRASHRKKAKHKTKTWRLKMLKKGVRGGNIANVLFYAWFLLKRKKSKVCASTSEEIQAASVSNIVVPNTMEGSKQGKVLDNANFQSQEKTVSERRQMKEENDKERSEKQVEGEVAEHPEEEMGAGGDVLNHEEEEKLSEGEHVFKKEEEEERRERGSGVIDAEEENGRRGDGVINAEEETEEEGCDMVKTAKEGELGKEEPVIEKEEKEELGEEIDVVKNEEEEAVNINSDKNEDYREKKILEGEKETVEDVKEIERVEEGIYEKRGEKRTDSEPSEQGLKTNGDKQIEQSRKQMHQSMGQEQDELEGRRSEGGEEGVFEIHDSWKINRKRRIRGWFRKKWRNLCKAFSNSKSITSETNQCHKD